ncbi:MAG: ChuX/HutX family heme-like substrate-binding protein [Caulobacterales bacterium]|jgi:hypothetical protein
MQTTSSLLENPDALLAAWRDLMAKHHHLHNPQAAMILGVPEAALIAARVGDGAMALQPDVGALLATASQWRRVLIAVRSAAGVWLGFDHIDGFEARDWITLQGQSFITAKLRADAVAHAFWFEDEDDMHGRTQSLQLFDAAGRDVAKVLILHKSAAEEARARFQTLALPHQNRALTLTSPGAAARPAPSQASHALFAFMRALDRFPDDLIFENGHADAAGTYRGPIESTSYDEMTAHAYAMSLKLHLRPMGVQTARIAADEAVFGVEGEHALRIAPRAPSAAWSRIVEAQAVGV